MKNLWINWIWKTLIWNHQQVSMWTPFAISIKNRETTLNLETISPRSKTKRQSWEEGEYIGSSVSPAFLLESESEWQRAEGWMPWCDVMMQRRPVKPLVADCGTKQPVTPPVRIRSDICPLTPATTLLTHKRSFVRHTNSDGILIKVTFCNKYIKLINIFNFWLELDNCWHTPPLLWCVLWFWSIRSTILSSPTQNWIHIILTDVKLWILSWNFHDPPIVAFFFLFYLNL